jgi:hypothetical protein
MQGQKSTVRLSVEHSNGNVQRERQSKGINTLSVAALTAAEKLQEGEIARFKGCSQKAKKPVPRSRKTPAAKTRIRPKKRSQSKRPKRRARR